MPFVHFLSSSSLLPFLFSFLLLLIINLNGFIKCLGPNSGTLPSWQESRHVLVLQKHLHYEPTSWPAQTLTLHIPPLQHYSLKGSFIPRVRADAYLGALKALCAWLWGCDDHIFRAHPFYPHLHCMEAHHHPGMHLGGPIAAMWDTMLGMSFFCHLSLRSRMAKMQKYLRGDHRRLQRQEVNLWISDVTPKRSHVSLNQVYTTGFKGCFMAW